MNEQSKAIMGTIVMVACLVLLGFLVYAKAEGATIAAVAVVTTLIGFFTRSPERKDPPANAGIVVAAAIGSILASVACGCAPPKTPREEARSVVLLVADGVRQADLACASVARAKGDVSLAENCSAIEREAREALIVAEDALDLWDAVDHDRPSCAVKVATDALQRIVGVVRRAGGKVPRAVDDAFQLAPRLAGACNG